MARGKVIVFPRPLLVVYDELSLKIQRFQCGTSNWRIAPRPAYLFPAIRNIVRATRALRGHRFPCKRKRGAYCFRIVSVLHARSRKIWPIFNRKNGHAFIPIVYQAALLVQKLLQHLLAEAFYACLKHQFRIASAHIDRIILYTSDAAYKRKHAVLSAITVMVDKAMAQQQKARCLLFCDSAKFHRFPILFPKMNPLPLQARLVRHAPLRKGA